MKRMKQSLCLVFALLLSAVMALGSTAAVQVDEPIAKALDYYRTELAPSFANGDLVADVWETICVVQAGKADDAQYQFMLSEGPALTEQSLPSDYAKKIIAYILLDKDASSLASELAAMQDDSGAFVRGETQLVTNTSYSVLALLAARANGVEVSFDCDKAIAAITAQAKADGGYNDYGEEGNVDTTGMVLLGLAAAEANGCSAAAGAVDSAAAFIQSTLQDTGYFVGEGMYDSPNACSQAYAILGLIAAGEDMADAKWDASINALLACQDVGGGFWFQEDRVEGQWPFAPDQMSTYQAIMALQDYQAQRSFLVAMTLENEQEDGNSTVSEENISDGQSSQMESQNSVASTPASALSQSGNNPKTGDEGISAIVWIVLGIAIVAVIVVAVVPMFAKKKQKGDQTQDTDPKDQQ